MRQARWRGPESSNPEATDPEVSNP
jgi:hypothetical protein